MLKKNSKNVMTRIDKSGKVCKSLIDNDSMLQLNN